ncbi:MAG: hypothetical protein H7Y42_05045 [Chitinophagaceae bacterium]|nr:hypothetical protein [Chitinophagaceae bacterium]
MENDQPSLFGLSVDQESAATLKSAAQWGKVLAVLGWILGGLVLLFGIVAYIKITHTYRGSGFAVRSAETGALRALIVCILFSSILVTGAIFTWNFSNRTNTALDTTDQYSLNSGLSSMKSGMIFWAIIFIVFILLMLLAFLGIASSNS